VSSANRQRRLQNRETRKLAAEEHLRRTKRQRIVFAVGGFVLAVVVALVLVVRPWKGGSNSAASTTTTLGPTTTELPSVAGKPCVAVSSPLPKGAPAVPVKVGPPPTKLVKQDLTVGTGAVVEPGATIGADYIGVACSTGKIFDSSYSRNQSITTSLSDVVQGWQEGIPGMRVGGTRLLGLPPALAYGSASPPGSGIAPNETLWFVVHIKSTKTAAATTTTAPPVTTTPRVATTTAPAVTTTS
jgi:peptidylprolyl isomerase